MGFKRTSEGRVFFQGTEQDTEAPDSPVGGKELQILGLLRALNDRLKNLQMERSRMVKELGEYRELVVDLEGRLDRSEQSYIDLEQKLALRQNEHSKKITRAEKVIKDTIQEVLDAKEQLDSMESQGGVTAEQFTALKDQLAKLSVAKDSEAGKRLDALEKMYAGLQQSQKDQGEKMVDHVAAYVALTKRVSDAERRFDEQDNKIADTNERQDRVERKIEKAAQDRTRMLRKVDRIEEAVMQMRDTINAKAMVVLTDSEQPTTKAPSKQEPQAKAPQPVSEAPLHASKPVLLEKKVDESDSLMDGIKSAMQSPYAKVAVVMMVGAALLASALSIPTRDSFMTAKGPATSSLGEREWETAVVITPPEIQSTPAETDAFEDVAEDYEAEPQQSELDLPPVSEQQMVQDDIGTLPLDDDEQLLQLLADDPEGLARGLNAIEPGDAEPETMEMANVDPTAGSVETAAPKPAARKVVAPEDIPAPSNEVAGVDIQPDPDLPAAVQRIEEQALQGVAEAQHDLAAVYTAGHAGVTQNFDRAAMWFQKAAEQGVANAAYNMGVLHHQGLGMKPDIDEAIRWYAMAAEQGHPEAQYNLAIAYIEGIGVGYNPSQAAEYFESAAKQGIVEAAYNLGLIYENGLTGKVEPDKALRWYKFAADKGSPEAKSALEQLAKTLGIGLDDVNTIVDGMNAPKPKAQAPVIKSENGILAKKTAASVTNVLADDAPKLASIRSNAPGDGQALLIAEVQKHLIRLGLYPGPADGIDGPLTQDAVRSYQNATNLPVNGQINEELLDHMASLALFGDTELSASGNGSSFNN